MGYLQVAGMLLLPLCAPAQNLLPTDAHHVGTNLAVFENRESRKDLPCSVTPVKPVLGFDLRFHAGFEIVIPLRELSGSENHLDILFRVVPVDRKEEPAYLSQHIRVPPIDDNAKGDAYLEGTFDLGEGRYQVDWLMRDRTERVCAHFWDAEASLPQKDKGLALTMTAGQVAAAAKEQFEDEPAAERPAASGESVSIKVLVNFAPQNSRASTLQPVDTSALVSILRTIQRDPRIRRVSLVAFNLQQQKILFRQEAADRIDFPAIGDALKGLQLGRVEVTRLAQKDSETEFLGTLIRDEFKAGGEQADALIIAGPKVMLDRNVPQETLKVVGDPAYPVFYMNYNLYPNLAPWRDSIGHAVRYFKGQEYTISRPRDLWFAVSEVVDKIVKLKAGRQVGSAVYHRGSANAAQVQ